MGSLNEILRKQGGMGLIKQYIQSGALITAVGEFLLLGKSRTALEILRLSTQLKTKQKLKKKYGPRLNEFDKSYDQNSEHITSDRVWFCWMDGLDCAPQIVQICFKSICQNMPDKNITLITEENMHEFVNFPDYIIQKWKAGKITTTHLTDLLRLELLIRYGGMWLDATVLCSDKNIPEYYFNSDLFFYQCLKPGRDGHSTYISSWLISAKTNNKILMATRFLLYEYWKRHESLADYFLLHDFMSIVLEYYPEEWKRVVPRDNATPHILQLRLFDEFDQDLWDAITKQTSFHKLTYKLKLNKE
ncbi:MAG: capsular polysaccharide synthesis protein, partial [Lachnospiraceae bacterium]|nr:capsular polysaccharide synthesis protein [Lachnospiraceae bacterium]